MLKYCAMRRTTIRGLFGSLQKSGCGLHSMNPVDQLPESALERVEQQAPSGALRPRIRKARRSRASDSPMPGERMESPNGPASRRTRDGVFVAVDAALGGHVVAGVMAAVSTPRRCRSPLKDVHFRKSRLLPKTVESTRLLDCCRSHLLPKTRTASRGTDNREQNACKTDDRREFKTERRLPAMHRNICGARMPGSGRITRRLGRDRCR